MEPNNYLIGQVFINNLSGEECELVDKIVFVDEVLFELSYNDPARILVRVDKETLGKEYWPQYTALEDIPTSPYAWDYSYPKGIMREPYVCPVCQGKCTVPCNFYSGRSITSNASDVTCRACGGNGIIWSECK